MKKFAFAATLIFMLLLAACGAPEQAETAPEETMAETVSETSSDTSTEPEVESDSEVDAEPATISGLGIDQGNYNDEEAGVRINIQSTAWGGAEADVINFTASKMYDTAFSAKILYPEKIYEMHFGDGMWYRFNPETSEIIDSWFDVDAEITDLTGKDAVTFSGEFVAFIDSYCIDAFGYRPEELIMMMYE